MYVYIFIFDGLIYFLLGMRRRGEGEIARKKKKKERKKERKVNVVVSTTTEASIFDPELESFILNVNQCSVSV